MSRTKSDLARTRAMTEEEIEKKAREDPDAQPWDDEFLASAQFIDLEDILPKSRKTRVTLRLDADIVEWAKSLPGGRGYQTRINAILRAVKERAERRREAQ